MKRLRQLILLVSLAVPMLVTGSAATHAATGPTWTLPPANGQFDYQIGGAYKPASTVAIVDRDRTAKPAAGVYNICYINGFQTQAYEDKWWETHHDNLLLRRNGQYVSDPGWPGEILLDTSTAAKRSGLTKVLGPWIDGCAKEGFSAIELDNLDSNTRSHHLLTQADDMDFAATLTSRAHDDGLAMAQKNDAELGAKARQHVGFDFAIAEECQVYNECGYYLRDYGDHVIEIEYQRTAFEAACKARGSHISIILRDRNVVPKRNENYVYESC